jgi:bifunctional DNA-binding transcriptional regulator/antitoxin component of YhaV-PrlF toxin-antitoxin module
MLNFSKEILDTLGWQEGDDLIFLDQEDGSVLIKKADENQ